MRFPVRRVYTLAAVAALLVVAGMLVVMHRPPPTGFSWARAQGWSIAPVRVVRLQPRWIRRFEPMPPPVSPKEVALVRRCEKYGYSAASLRAYQQLAAQNPGSFYPKHRIACWYEVHNNLPQYWAWEQQALKQAPQVLAGKVVDSRGKPMPNLAVVIQAQTLEDLGGPIRQRVTYDFEATADSAGCWYLPVYQGLYVTMFQQMRLIGASQGRGRSSSCPLARLPMGIVNLGCSTVTQRIVWKSWRTAVRKWLTTAKLTKHPKTQVFSFRPARPSSLLQGSLEWDKKEQKPPAESLAGGFAVPRQR